MLYQVSTVACGGDVLLSDLVASAFLLGSMGSRKRASERASNGYGSYTSMCRAVSEASPHGGDLMQGFADYCLGGIDMYSCFGM